MNSALMKIYVYLVMIAYSMPIKFELNQVQYLDVYAYQVVLMHFL